MNDMDNEKIEKYKKLKADADGLNKRIQEVEMRRKILMEQLKEKMIALGVNSAQELAAKIAEQEALLEAETDRITSWIDSTKPVLEKLEAAL